MRPAEKAWMGLLGGVAIYEVFAAEDEMLSHAVDRWLLVHPIITWSAICITSLHLLNVLPQSIDPFHLAFLWRKRT